MRRQHAVLLVSMLAILILGAVWLLRKDPVMQSAGPIPRSVVEAEERSEDAAEAADLAAPEGSGPGRETRNVAVADSAGPEGEASPDAVATTGEGEPRLLGRVVDRAGRAIANAEVALDERAQDFRFSIGGEGGTPAPAFGRTTTDAEGRFEFVSPREPEVSLSIGADGYAPFEQLTAIRVDGDHDLGSLTLEQGVILAGQVIDATGRGVEGARVASFDENPSSNGMLFLGGRARHVTKTDEKGMFRIARQRSGLWKLRVTHADHPVHMEEGETRRPGERVEGIVIMLTDGAFIRGIVTGIPEDHEGEISVIARQPGAGLGGARRVAQAEADGTFELRGLDRDVEVELFAVGDGPQSMLGRSLPRAVARSGSRGVEVPFASTQTLSFRVVDAKTGQPIERMEVSRGVEPFLAPLFDTTDLEGSGRPKPKRFFPDGIVEVDSVSAGAPEETRLRISALGYELHEMSLPRGGGEKSLTEVRLKPSRTLEVIVLDKGGAPVEDARVRLAVATEGGHGFGRALMTDEEGNELGGDMGLSGKTGADGVVVLSSRPGQRMTLHVKHADYAPFEGTEILIPAQDGFQMEVELSRGGQVTVLARDENGEPLVGVSIDHRKEEATTGEAGMMATMVLGGEEGHITDSEGRVVFDHLPIGDHSFKLASRKGGGMFSGDTVRIRRSINGAAAPVESWETVFVDEASATEVTLIGKPPALLEGEILEGGEPLVGAELALKRADDPMPHLPGMGGGPEALTDGQGLYVIRGAEAGEYVLTVTHPKRAMPAEFELELFEGQNAFDADLDVAIIEGRVEDAQGRPVEGARVTAVEAGGTRRTATRMSVMFVGGTGGGDMSVESFEGDAAGVVRTDVQGRYELRGVKPNAELKVRVDADGYQRIDSDSLELRPNQVRAGVNLVVERGVDVEVTVTNDAGAPVSFCMVRATYNGDREDVTDPGPSVAQNGLATFEGLAPGPWTFSAQTIGGIPGTSGDSREAEPREQELVSGEPARVDLVLP